MRPAYNLSLSEFKRNVSIVTFVARGKTWKADPNRRLIYLRKQRIIAITAYKTVTRQIPHSTWWLFLRLDSSHAGNARHSSLRFFRSIFYSPRPPNPFLSTQSPVLLVIRMSIPQGLYLNISFWFNDIPRPVVCSSPAALVLFLFLLPHSLHDRASTILSISDCPALLHDFFLASGSLACTACTFIPLTPDHHFLAHCASFSSGADTTVFIRSGLTCSPRKNSPSPAFRQRAIRD